MLCVAFNIFPHDYFVQLLRDYVAINFLVHADKDIGNVQSNRTANG